MAVSVSQNSDFGLPDLTFLPESERIQVMAVMQRAKDLEMKEEAISKSRQPLEGQLTKFTNVMKGWLPRWFILDPESGFLEYFEGSVISPSDEDSQTFLVNAANGEVYKLKATDAKERQQWVDRLRSTSQYHTALMAQTKRSRAKDPSPFVKRETRSSSMLSNLSHQIGPQKSGSSESLPQQSTQRASVPTHRAPMAHPHTIDPFQEVKEYMLDAEDYSRSLMDKINSLPHNKKPIGGLDTDLLLLKATSTATLHCLDQCLNMLQQRQEAFGVKGGVISAFCPDMSFAPYRYRKTINGGHSVPSPLGNFASTSELRLVLPDDSHREGPINHDDEVEDESEYKDKELEGMEEHKFVILQLLSQLKLGMDLTKVVLPTFILERRSLLELFADCMAHPDVFLRITNLSDPEDRMMAVLEWYLTSFHAGRQGSLAKKPYNPIIGETFHCSYKVPLNRIGANGDAGQGLCLMSYTAEQVSHHPPVSAFYLECPKRNVCMNASIYTKSKFMGMSIGVVLVGKIVLKLLDFDEEYVFGLPSVYARSILTTPWVELGDKIQITCQKTNLHAAVIFHTKPFYGGKLHRVTAEVKNGNTANIVCRVQGEWNSSFEFTYCNETTKLVDVNEMPVWKKHVRPLSMQGEYESRKLWAHVTNALKLGDLTTATEHKKFLEERQRESERHRHDTNTNYIAKYFCKVGDTWMYKNMLEKPK